MPKTIHCEIWTQEGPAPAGHKTIVQVARPVAAELSDHDQVRRIMELAAEQLPPEKPPGHGGAR